MIYLSKNNLQRITLLGFILFIPLSTSLTSIFWGISLVSILLIPSFTQRFSSILKSPVSWFSAGIFTIATLSCLWGIAPLSLKFSMLGKYLKFLFFPLLMIGFSNKRLRFQAMHLFLGAMLLTTLLSFLKWAGLLIWRTDDPGQIFYNHIMTAIMMSYAAYVTLWYAYSSKNKWHQLFYILLLLLFSFQIFFISPGRTGYVLYFMLAILFLLQTLSFKKAIIMIMGGGLLFGLIIYQSPIVKERISLVAHDILDYQHHQMDTSLGFRMQFHDYAKELFYRHPVIGNGLGGFEYSFMKENPIPAWSSQNPRLLEPHSEYWLILCEFGLIGFFIFCLFLIALTKEITKLKEMRLLAVGIFMTFLVGNVSDSLFFYATTQLFFMGMMAICLGEKYED